jgi:hypothetical protein
VTGTVRPDEPSIECPVAVLLFSRFCTWGNATQRISLASQQLIKMWVHWACQDVCYTYDRLTWPGLMVMRSLLQLTLAASRALMSCIT